MATRYASVKMVSAGIAIRPLRKTDYNQIREIERVSVDEYLRYLKETGETDTVEPSITPEYFEHYLKMGSSFVAEADGEVVGYILSQPTSFIHSRRKELWLEYVVVSPTHRRKGIGSKLLTETARWARRYNIHLLYTNFNPNNPESASLLEKQGFEVRNWMTAEMVLK